MKKIIFTTFLSFFSIALISCEGREAKLERDTLEINGNTLSVEIAKTAEERNQGLMERKSLDKESGMLFVFQRDEKLSFWMKNTYISLSIAFINSSGEIKEIKEMTPLNLDSVSSKNYVRFALEVNQGWFQENGIKPGDRVILPEKYRK